MRFWEYPRHLKLGTLGISDHCKAPSLEVPWYATAQPLSSSRNQPLSPDTCSLFHAPSAWPLAWYDVTGKCNGHHRSLCRQSSIIVDTLHLHCETFPPNREVVLFATCSVSVQTCSRKSRISQNQKAFRSQASRLPRYIFRPSSLVSRKSWTCKKCGWMMGWVQKK